MTKDQETLYKQKRLEILYYELYNLESEHAFTIGLIDQKLPLVMSYDKQLTDLTAKLPILPKKATTEEKKAHNLIQLEINGVNFKKNVDIGKLSKLYREIAERAIQIKAIRRNIDFINALDLDKVPLLDYIEINGTHYELKDNLPVLDDNGQMRVHLKSNVENNSTEKDKA